MIPAGSYSIGCDRSLPCFSANKPRTVTTPAFWIDKFKITSAEFAACIRVGWCSEVDAYLREEPTHVVNTFLGGARHYCAWRGGRLPTADEWEIAARGSDRRLYPWGNKFDTARLPKVQHEKQSACVTELFFLRNSDPASESPFGVSEMSGGNRELALRGDSAELRGAPNGDDGADPFDYSVVTTRDAPGLTVAAFRCVYDQKPN